MPFPEVRRVIYGKNPLNKVVCQLRFPTILKIDAEIPVQFQERMRQDFPHFSETTRWKTIPQEIAAQVPPEVLTQALQTTSLKNYEFVSVDGNWIVNLTRTFVAISTKEYDRWEDFKTRLQLPIEALVDAYAPTFLTRIGLRYIDVIRRSSLGLDGVDWSELLEPHVTGILGLADFNREVEGFESTYTIRLADGSSVVRMVMKLAEEENEQCFVIDSDFFSSQKTPIDAAMTLLDFLNVRGSRLIQWVVSERLHEAMEPQVL